MRSDPHRFSAPSDQIRLKRLLATFRATISGLLIALVAFGGIIVYLVAVPAERVDLRVILRVALSIREKLHVPLG